jgi:hypothetical protein
MRRIIFNHRMMDTAMSKLRPASPAQASLQPLDKRPRLTPPGPAAAVGHTEKNLIAPKRNNNKKKRRPTLPEFGSSEDVISREVVALLGDQVVAQAEADGVEWESPFGFREEVELTVSSISSSGMSHLKVCVAATAYLLSHVCCTRMVGDEYPLEQVKDLRLPHRRSVHGLSSFRSFYPERSFAPAYTGMQGCTLSLTFSALKFQTRNCVI